MESEIPVVTEGTAMLLLTWLPVLALAGVLFSAWQLGLWNRLSGFNELDPEQSAWPRVMFVLSLLVLVGWLGWRYHRSLPWLAPKSSVDTLRRTCYIGPPWTSRAILPERRPGSSSASRAGA